MLQCERSSTSQLALLLGAGVLPVHAAGMFRRRCAARLQMLAPGMEPDSVVETPLAGMYEVRFGSIIVYLSDDAASCCAAI